MLAVYNQIVFDLFDRHVERPGELGPTSASLHDFALVTSCSLELTASDFMARLDLLREMPLYSWQSPDMGLRRSPRRLAVLVRRPLMP